jgi:hypothetical protein
MTGNFPGDLLDGRQGCGRAAQRLRRRQCWLARASLWHCSANKSTGEALSADVGLPESAKGRCLEPDCPCACQCSGSALSWRYSVLYSPVDMRCCSHQDWLGV